MFPAYARPAFIPARPRAPPPSPHTTFVLLPSPPLPNERNLSGIFDLPLRSDHEYMDRLSRAAPGERTMHDLLIALAFVGMVVAPAIVAAKSGAEADDAELD